MTQPLPDAKRPRLGPSPSYADHTSGNRLPPLPPTPTSSVPSERNHGAYPHGLPEHHASVPHNRPPYPPPYEQSRHYSNEPLSARPPPSPSGAEQGFKPMPPGPYGDPYPTVVDAANHQHAREHYPENLPPSHGLPLPQYQQATRPMAYPTPQHQVPEPGYDGYGMPFSQANGAARKKAVRASQACESCRSKKCKCDEEKPVCGTCAQNNTHCSYRDVPPPKQERTMNQLMELIENVCNRLTNLEDTMQRDNKKLRDELRNDVHRALHGIPPLVSDHSYGSDYTTPHPQSAYPDASQRQGFGTKRESLEQAEHSPSSPTGSHSGQHGVSKQNEGLQSSWPESASEHLSRKEAQLDKDLAGKDILAGQLSIPPGHRTGAHKLLIHWEAIKPFYKGIADPFYVTREEQGRGVLKIWGRGEGHDGTHRPNNRWTLAMSPSTRSDPESVTTTSSNADGSWGKGFDASTASQFKRGQEDYLGGLGPDDALILDAVTVNRLQEAFFQNIWVMHPILNRPQFHTILDDFIATYSNTTKPEMPSHGSPGGALNFQKGPKRKRSGETLTDAEKLPHATQSGRSCVEHSPENALILMVLALGKICEHKHYLPSVVSDMGPPDSIPSPRFAGSPPHAFRSPHVTGTSSTATTPKVDGENATPRKLSRNSSVDGSFPSKRSPRNVDRIPGLAYFAYATEILGEIHGTVSLTYLQACILAGLYKGQLARVMESWKWIYEACLTWLLLIKGEVNLESTPVETALEKMSKEKADARRVTYWTCLQLESDILAEFDFLPHSSISQFEDQIQQPAGPTIWSKAPEHELLMLYYGAQIHLRKLLNRAHSALYNNDKGQMRNPGWSITNSDELAFSLQEWKRYLPAPLQWDDDDEPANHINAARLRGKYYGARYIIHRPFLHHALQKEMGILVPVDKELGLPEHRRIIDMSTKCVNAAIKSTRAFDGLQGRPIITNPFGTAQAQFGNMLVLAATKSSSAHSWMVEWHLLESLFQRTFTFLGHLTPHSKTMRTNVRILENAKSEVARVHGQPAGSSSAAASFGSNP